MLKVMYHLMCKYLNKHLLTFKSFSETHSGVTEVWIFSGIIVIKCMVPFMPNKTYLGDRRKFVAENLFVKYVEPFSNVTNGWSVLDIIMYESL